MDAHQSVEDLLVRGDVRRGHHEQRARLEHAVRLGDEVGDASAKERARIGVALERVGVWVGDVLNDLLAYDEVKCRRRQSVKGLAQVLDIVPPHLVLDGRCHFHKARREHRACAQLQHAPPTIRREVPVESVAHGRKVDLVASSVEAQVFVSGLALFPVNARIERRHQGPAGSNLGTFRRWAEGHRRRRQQVWTAVRDRGPRWPNGSGQ
mmetsp:Transcript_8061/g.21070  ORF Transcript_8061/g.21070 Transcript_8061/m.21070 type:complete len:209 (-) Transcript_8061:111-737(-)